MRGFVKKGLLLLACYHHHACFSDAFLVHPAPALVQQRVRSLACSSSSTSSRDDTTPTPIPHETLGRALDCSQEYGLCDIDEMLSLADELESFQDQALFHTNNHSYLHLREVKDRFDIADVLRLEAQLSLRQQHLRDDNNIFRTDVKESLAMKSRDQLMELVDMF